MYTARLLTRYVAGEAGDGEVGERACQAEKAYAVAWSVGRSVCPASLSGAQGGSERASNPAIETNAGPAPVAGLWPHAKSWFSL